MTAASINTVIICFGYGRSVLFDRIIQQKRGLNSLQLLIDGRRKPIDEKMQDTAHAYIAWEPFCSACVKRKFPTFSISSIGETLPEKFLILKSHSCDNAKLAKFLDITKR